MATLAETAPGAGKDGVGGIGSDLSSIASILKLFTKTPAKTVTDSTTETTGLQLGPEQVQALLKSVLQGTGSVQGLASVAGGQKAPGLYKSTVQQQLVNDLLARVATETAAKAAPTTRTVSGTRTAGAEPAAIDPVKALVATLGGTLGKKAFAASGAEDSIDEFFANIFGSGASAAEPIGAEAFVNFLGGGGGSAFSSAGADSGISDMISQAFSSVGGAGIEATGGFVNQGLSDLVNFSSANAPAATFSTDIAASSSPITGVSGGAGFGQAASTGAKAASSSISDAFASSSSIFDESDFYAQTLGIDAFGDQAAQLAEQTAGAGFDAVNFGGGGFDTTGVPWLSAGSKLLQGDVGGAFGVTAGTIIGSFFGPIGGAIGGALGSFLGSSCFITTATCEVMGKADDCEELQTLRTFRDSWLKENHPEDIAQYYEEAPEIVEKIKTLDLSADLFTYMYHAFILPAVEKVKAQDFQGAYIAYKQLFTVAKAFAGANA